MQFFVQQLRHCTMAVLVASTLMLTGCADGNSGASPGTRSASKVEFCKRGDQVIASSSQCLRDGAACYELTNGKWCTGERGNVCPAGSTEIPAGAACPNGARCISYGENLNCAIQFQ